MEYVLVNNVVTKKTEANLSAFLWDTPFIVSQKVWFGYGGIPLLPENVASLKGQLAILGFELPPLFNNYRELFRLCKRILNKNKHYRSGHLDIRIFASENGINSLIISEGNTNFDFPISEEGLLLNFSGVKKNSTSSLQQFAFQSNRIWQVAENQIKNTSFNNSVLLNEKDFVCEGLKANIFLLKDNTLITPSPGTGCYSDVIRKIILELSTQVQLKIIESGEVTREMLFTASEIFLASEAGGIQWVLGLENKRFIRSFSLELHQHINSYLKTKVNS